MRGLDYYRLASMRCSSSRASRELTDTDAPVAEIALRMGFFDQSHFARVFRVHTGLTPTEFRAASNRATPVPIRI